MRWVGTLGRARAGRRRAGARRAERVEIACGARLARALSPGSPEAAARAGSMRAAGGGGVQQPGGCAAPRAPPAPPAHARSAGPAPAAPPRRRRLRPTFQFPPHLVLIYDTFHNVIFWYKLHPPDQILNEFYAHSYFNTLYPRPA